MQLFHEFRDSSEADVAISLLRSRDAWLWLSLMAAHLNDGQRMDAHKLATAMDVDLQELFREYTPSKEVGEGITDSAAPSSGLDAEAVLTRWTKKRWVHRGVDDKTGREFYQLTSGAARAVHQMLSLNRRTSVATESALTMVMGDVAQIAADSDPDPHTRRQAIDDQIAALVDQRDALDKGEPPTVDHIALVDKIIAVSQIIDRMPADIARYGEQLQANTAQLLHSGFYDDPAAFASSLHSTLDGHDDITKSPEGQAFRAFATLISQPPIKAQFESDIANILARVRDVPKHLTHSLEGFVNTMWRQVREANRKRVTANRRYSQFIRTGGAVRYRTIRARVAATQEAATKAFQHTHGGRDIGFTIPGGGVDVNSIGRLRLASGAPTKPATVSNSTQEFNIDASSLLAKEAFNPDTLRQAVNNALDKHHGFTTLAEVLALLTEPRTGDIFYLWQLASTHGHVKDTLNTTVWAHTDRGRREITMPFITYDTPVPQLNTPRPQHNAVDEQPTLWEEPPDA